MASSAGSPGCAVSNCKITDSPSTVTFHDGLATRKEAATLCAVRGVPSSNFTPRRIRNCHCRFPAVACHDSARKGCTRPLASLVTRLSKISEITLRRANESSCAVSAGSSDDRVALSPTWSVPPYCLRISAPAAALATSRLLIASHCQAKRFIASCFHILHDRDGRIAPGLGPQCGDLAREISRCTRGHGIAVGNLIRAHRIAPASTRRRAQNLPTGTARTFHHRHIAAPFQSRRSIAHAIDHVHLSINAGQQPKSVFTARQRGR